MAFPPLLRDADGNIIPQIWDGNNWQPYRGQVEGLDALTMLVEGLANTDYATDTKLEAVRVLLDTISKKDFATEATLASILAKLADPATAGKQDAAKGVLDAISTAVAARATEGTLGNIKTSIDTIKGTGASETTLAQLKTELANVKAELAAIKANQLSGDQKVTLSGTIAEKASAQHSESATTVKTYTRAAGASRIEVYVETGRVRIRTDGEPCTAVSGEPLGEGFGAAWAVPSISVLFIDDSAVTVVSR